MPVVQPAELWQESGRWEQYGQSELKIWEKDPWDRLSWRPLSSTGERQTVTDPPIGIVIDDDLSMFQERLQQVGFPNTTINSTRNHLLPIFNHAAPRGARGGGRGDLLVRPFCPPLDAVLDENFIPSEADVAAFFRAAASAKWPVDREVPARHWWEALIVFLVNYGLRCSDWKRLAWDVHLLANGSQLKYVAHKTRRKRPHPVLFEINETTRWFLQRIRSKAKAAAGNHQLFFSARSRHYFEPEWNRLVEMAGVSRKVTKSDGKTYELFDRHSLRRFCNQYMNDHCDGNPGQWLLNHAFSSDSVVNHRHYSRIYMPPQSVTEALHTVPQLPIFIETMNAAA